ncbi:SDR family oxidoreductase [Arsenicitalea aurantiaca]|uniref:SDR family oxidoreductase n=1 Tax=Arsenicitalea aurantiaca TaxID=1783274 RepID=A0A433XF34_9HYPH|nr:SDR family oxidoreductase [Arsenicitalea aurantiaca]RUT32614.1 SDR family oxidoreductase [Arsenicitalea aurantiaca]
MVQDFEGRVAIVTGATGGVGLETARELARRGFTVGVHGRSEEKGEAAIRSIADTARYPDRLHFLKADLADLSAVRSLAGTINDRFAKVDVLINNAGLVNARRKVTIDGFEETFAVNHLAHFLLTGLILDRIRSAAPARIINLSSNAHLAGKMHFDDLQAERRYSTFGVYGNTKLANLLFTFELARRLSGSGVTVNAVHPGAVATGFAQNNGGLAMLAMRILRPFFLTPEKGAATSIHVATAPELEAVTGRYFYKSRQHKTSARAQDAETARLLWERSEEMTGYPFAESLLPASLLP